MFDFKKFFENESNKSIFNLGKIDSYSKSFTISITLPVTDSQSLTMSDVQVGGFPGYNFKEHKLGLVPKDSEVGREEDISELIKSAPTFPSDIFTYKGDDFKVRIMFYKLKLLLFFCGYLVFYVPKIKEYCTKYGLIEGLEKGFSDISGFGYEPQIVLLLSNSLLQKLQTKYQTYSGLDLSLEEIDSLESVSEARRRLNIKFTSYLLSEEYSKLSDIEQEKKRKGHQNSLDAISNDLWRVVNLGTRYLSSSARMVAKIDGSVAVDDALLSLRKSELSKLRSLGGDYKLPLLES